MITKFSVLNYARIFIVVVAISRLFSIATASELYPNALMKHEAQWLIKVLEQAHYNKVSVRDLNSTAFVDEFISKLDKQKLYFTLDDVNDIHLKYDKTMATHLLEGNLLPGFEIYNQYKSKAVSRLTWVLEQLNKDPDLFHEGNFTINRDEEDWAQNENQLEPIWQNLIKSDFLREVLLQIDKNETAQKVNPQDLKEYIIKSRENLKRSYSKWIENINEFEASDVQEIYLTTLTHMYDPHSTFLNIKEKERFDQAMNNEFVGIGARLQDEDGYCTIKELLPGGPAEASRDLEPEDIILKVAQSEGEYIDVVDMKLNKIVELIKGPKDTLVRLEIRPIKDPSSTKEVRIIRDKIKLTENLAKAFVKQIHIHEEKVKIGIIELPSFYGSSGNGPKATDDVEELIAKLKEYDIEALILDLRRNGGGYLTEAVNLTGLFISRGPVVQVRDTDGKIRKKFDFNPKVAWEGPLFTLVSRYSASASEIVAGALQDHKRSVIIGDRNTHGKGTVQSMIQMNLPFNLLANQNARKTSAAKITIQKYYLPSGKSTQINGVSSDISIPSINMFLPIGESDLDNSLANDKIAAVNFRKSADQFSFSENDIENLNKDVAERRVESTIFQYLNENITYVKNKRKQKSFSLNLDKRLQYREIENNMTSRLKDTMDSFSSLSYPTKQINLNIVDDQINQSRKVRGLDLNDSKQDSFFSIPEDFDLSLNEGINIVSDYLKKGKSTASVHKGI
jgi:carboxyl-terminal processing protease